MKTSIGVLLSKSSHWLAQLPHLSRGLSLAWEATRFWTLLWLGLLIVDGLLPAGLVYIIRIVVDALVLFIRSDGTAANVRQVMIAVSALATILLLSEIIRAAISWIRSVQAELLQDHISQLIHKKSIGADLAFYDRADYYDHLHRARAEASYRPVALLENTGTLLKSIVTLSAMGAVLVPLGPWLSLALLLSAVPALIVVLRYALAQYHFRLRTTADERRTWYYSQLMTSSAPAAEIRLFGLGERFQTVYEQLRKRLRTERFLLARQQGVADLTASLIALLIAGSALVWMVWKALQGLVTLGELALVYAAFNQAQRVMRSLLESVGQLYANSLFLGNLFEFLSLPSIVDEVSDNDATSLTQINRSIAFNGVSFRYDETQSMALDRFNLTVPAGKIVAIVGPNGAGKSTLLKLLCRFYDPTEGSIEIDGIDLRKIPTRQLRRFITVLFQQPVHYNNTVSENIEFGDPEMDCSEVQIQAAIEAAGVQDIVDRLPQGKETLLGKWFSGGSELSVGEWQRIALARAFLRRAQLILLDEPTSALDPWAESDWLQRFRQLANRRTAILITHRFTTAMHADVIYVMDHGRIIESGNHYELIESNGMYARSWSRQMASVTSSEPIEVG